MNFARVFSGNNPDNIKKAAELLREGGVVAFPTETVYGLGADAFNSKAVCRVFEIKKRPSFDPLIVHVCDKDSVQKLWKQVPPLAKQLMDTFWPGPLTLVLPKTDLVPDVVTSGLDTVAVRMPKHPVALKLIELLANPIAAPSANLFGYTSPTSASHVKEDLGASVDAVLDGGDCEVGVESTVVKIEKDGLVLLRPGGITKEQLEKIAPVKIFSGQASSPESPGLIESHYAPWTPFFVLDKKFEIFLKGAEKMVQAYQIQKGRPPRMGFLAFGPKADMPLFESVEVLSAKEDLYEAASTLFQAIRKLDKMNLDMIIAESVPEKGIGLAIMDRLKRASAGKTIEGVLC